ncbi:MAG: Ig-like domain-containing protein [Limisphaerales bacterium]
MQCLGTALSILALTASARGQNSVTLAWDPDAGTNIAGYKIYYGVASRTYTSTNNVGNVTNATVSGLTAGTVYYFAATAYDTSGLESAYSTEVVYTNPVAVAPAIALTLPVSGASFVAPAAITCAASVTANGHTITQVQFYNGATALGTVAAAPYNYSWNNVSAGTYSLSATAVYDSGSTVTSTPATVTVTNAAPPSIALTAPTNGAAYTAPAAITCAASVTANGHTITQLQFYSGATLLGAVAAAPYSFSWKNVSAGSYSLSAKAVYDSGSTVNSAAAGVTVKARKRPKLDINMAIAGTDATPAIVLPPPQSIILNASSGDPGLIYSIQSSPDLNTWTQIGTMTLDATGCCQFTNSVGASGPIGFYRLQGQ